MSNELTEFKSDTEAALAPRSAKDLATSDLDSKIKLAQMMAKSTHMVPAHLRGNPAECMAILFKALEWGMNPYAVAEKTSIINGRIMYEGQLVNAVINSSNQLKESLRYTFTGSGESLSCKCEGWKRNEETPRSVTVCMPKTGEAKNSPLWRTDPEQQLCYKAARVWCRRHMPEVLLGVYTKEDEFEDMNLGAGRAVQGTIDRAFGAQAPQPVIEAPQTPVEAVAPVEVVREPDPLEEALGSPTEGKERCGTCNGTGTVEWQEGEESGMEPCTACKGKGY